MTIAVLLPLPAAFAANVIGQLGLPEYPPARCTTSHPHFSPPTSTTHGHVPAKQIDFQFSTSRTTWAAADVCTTPWYKRSPHVPRNLCTSTCQPSLYCSLRDTQHLSCLKNRETVDDA